MLAKLAIPLTIALACAVLAVQALAASTRNVGLRDFSLTVSSATAPHGSITFRVKNFSGVYNHKFAIKRLSTGAILHNSRSIAPGQTISTTKNLAAGTYRLYCSIHPGTMRRNFTVT